MGSYRALNDLNVSSASSENNHLQPSKALMRLKIVEYHSNNNRGTSEPP